MSKADSCWLHLWVHPTCRISYEAVSQCAPVHHGVYTIKRHRFFAPTLGKEIGQSKNSKLSFHRCFLPVFIEKIDIFYFYFKLVRMKLICNGLSNIVRDHQHATCANEGAVITDVRPLERQIRHKTFDVLLYVTSFMLRFPGYGSTGLHHDFAQVDYG